jgi:hypothetical protein
VPDVLFAVTASSVENIESVNATLSVYLDTILVGLRAVIK